MTDHDRPLPSLVVVNDQPFNIVENNEFKEMLTFLRPGINIPSADTVHRDLSENYKISKDVFQQELQVNNFYYITI
jgi:hypothetical protein